MIFNKEDIITFMSSQELPSGEKALVTSKLEQKSGVFFNQVTTSEGQFLYFTIGVVDKDAEYKETKSFNAENAKSFFEAVDYFESLIQSRTPKEEKNPPSVGYFVINKSTKKLSAYVIGMGPEPIFIDSEDIAKVFTPPQKKPFGRLDMFAVDKPQYDVIKQKYALKYDAEKSDELGEDFFAYRMTPYQSNEDTEPGEPGEPTPPDVNDEQLTPEDIEGEDNQNMEGNPQGEPGDDDGDQGEDGEGGEPGEDGEGGEPGEDGDGGEPGEDGDGGEPGEDGEGGEPGEDGEGGTPSDNGQGENTDDELSERTPGDDDVNLETPQPGEEGGQETTEGGEIEGGSGGEPGENNNPSQAIANKGRDETESILNEALNVDDFVRGFMDPDIAMSVINAWSPKTLKDKLYGPFGVSRDVPPSQFKRELRKRIKTYFD
jgi:hypothetical protein